MRLRQRRTQRARTARRAADAQAGPAALPGTRQRRHPSRAWSVSTVSSSPSRSRIAARTRTPGTPHITAAVEPPSPQFISSRPSESISLALLILEGLDPSSPAAPQTRQATTPSSNCPIAGVRARSARGPQSWRTARLDALSALPEQVCLKAALPGLRCSDSAEVLDKPLAVNSVKEPACSGRSKPASSCRDGLHPTAAPGCRPVPIARPLPPGPPASAGFAWPGTTRPWAAAVTAARNTGSSRWSVTTGSAG